MMDNKETETIIEDSLNSEIPNKRILDNARQVLLQKKQSNNKKPWLFYVFASGSASLIVVGILFAVLNPFKLNELEHAASSISPDIVNITVSIILITTGILLGIFSAVIRFRKK